MPTSSELYALYLAELSFTFKRDIRGLGVARLRPIDCRAADLYGTAK